MNKMKKIGIIFIIIGAFIPTVLYPFTELTEDGRVIKYIIKKDSNHTSRLNELEIILKKGSLVEYETEDGRIKKRREGKVAIPYQYIFAVGITLAFIGIGLIALTGNKIKKKIGF